MKTLSKLLYVAVIAGIGFSSCEKSLTEPKLKNANDDVVGTLNSPTNPSDVVGTFNNNDVVGTSEIAKNNIDVVGTLNNNDVVGTLEIAKDHSDVVATLHNSNTSRAAVTTVDVVNIGNVYSYDEDSKTGFIQAPGAFNLLEFENNKNLVVVVGDDYRYQELEKNIPGEGKVFIRLILSKAN